VRPENSKQLDFLTKVVALALTNLVMAGSLYKVVAYVTFGHAPRDEVPDHGERSRVC